MKLVIVLRLVVFLVIYIVVVSIMIAAISILSVVFIRHGERAMWRARIWSALRKQRKADDQAAKDAAPVWVESTRLLG